MSEENFIANNFTNLPDTTSYTWSSPSNIALVKYWGKNKNQTPKNTSISFTLSNSRTITILELNKRNKVDNNILFDVYYKDKKMDEFKSKIYVHPNPISVKHNEAGMNNEKYILYAGRVSEEKGVEELINAFLNSELNNIKLKIVGDGPTLNYLKNNTFNSLLKGVIKLNF